MPAFCLDCFANVPLSAVADYREDERGTVFSLKLTLGANRDPALQIPGLSRADAQAIVFALQSALEDASRTDEECVVLAEVEALQSEPAPF